MKGEEKAVPAKSMHAGHRQRMKQRFFTGGLDGFAPHEILELLLYFSVPQRDTNPIAHRLMDTFGSLNAVLEAPAEELVKVAGITENSAALITLIRQISLAYMTESTADVRMLYTLDEVGQYLRPRFFGLKNEHVVLLSLDNMCRVLNCTTVYKGSVNATEVSARVLLTQALRDNATVAVLAHNHPNGLAIPSVEDIRTTEKLVKSFLTADIQLVDHMIFAEGDYISMWSSPSLRTAFANVHTPFYRDI